MRYLFSILLLPVLLLATWMVACSDNLRDELPFRLEDLRGPPELPDLNLGDLRPTADLAPPGDGPADAGSQDGGG